MFKENTLGASSSSGTNTTPSSANPMKEFEGTSPPDDSVSSPAFSPATIPQDILIYGSGDNNEGLLNASTEGTAESEFETAEEDTQSVCYTAEDEEDDYHSITTEKEEEAGQEGELNASTEGTAESEFETAEEDTQSVCYTAEDEEDDYHSITTEKEEEAGQEGELNASTEGTAESEFETAEEDTQSVCYTAEDEEDDYHSITTEKEEEAGQEGELNASTEGTAESEFETAEEDTQSVCSTAEDEEDDYHSITTEKEEEAGQESIPPKVKKLDRDEDWRKPEYIPRYGTYYEHDDRTVTKDISGGHKKAKKVRREHEHYWIHDRYDPDEQAPKSREEVIAEYGYDIRNEAHKRRRYRPQISTSSSNMNNGEENSGVV